MLFEIDVEIIIFTIND